MTSDKNGKLSVIAIRNIEDLSYSQIQKALRNKDVIINGVRTNCDKNIKKGDEIEIYYTPAKTEVCDTLFLDDNIFVVNKRRGFTSESVYERLKEKFANIRFVHRLDRNTAGVMFFALNFDAENALLNGFKKHTFDKFYLAEVYGFMPKEKDVLCAYMKKDAAKASVSVFDKRIVNSVPIKTGYEVIATSATTSLLKVKLFTGKTHQIRAHLAHLGHSVVGDGKYKNIDKKCITERKTQALTAVETVLHFDLKSPLYYLNNSVFNLKKTAKFDYSRAGQIFVKSGYDAIFE